MNCDIAMDIIKQQLIVESIQRKWKEVIITPSSLTSDKTRQNIFNYKNLLFPSITTNDRTTTKNDINSIYFASRQN